MRSTDIDYVLSTPYYKEEVNNTVVCDNMVIDYISYMF